MSSNKIPFDFLVASEPNHIEEEQGLDWSQLDLGHVPVLSAGGSLWAAVLGAAILGTATLGRCAGSRVVSVIRHCRD